MRVDGRSWWAATAWAGGAVLLTLLWASACQTSRVVTSPAWSAVEAGVPIVYSRCARTEQPLTISATATVGGKPTPVTKTLKHTDVVDALPDVVNFFGGFTVPCDLMFRAADGQERVLYDCASTSADQRTCAALDAAVSFDAKTIAFAVFRGSIARERLLVPLRFLHPETSDGGRVQVTLPNAYLDPIEAQIHLVDVGSGVVTPLPHTPGSFDSGPAWLADGRLAFTSTRSRQFSTPVSLSQRLASQIFSMDLDGRNVEKASYHALAGEQHPLQLLDGRVAVSSWQLFGMLPYRHTNSGPGGFGTLANFFHVYSQHPDGANVFPLFGQHTLNHGTGPSRHPVHFAAHFLGQSSDGRLWAGDYYRGNNSGLGQIVGFPVPPLGQEGIGPDPVPDPHDIFRPRGFTSLTSWANGFDSFANPMPIPALRIPSYRDPLAFAGKVSQPSGLPGNQLLLTWAAGGCSTVASGDLVNNLPFTSGSGGFPAMNTLTLLGRDNPGCDAGIYRTSRIPSRHPADLIPVVNRREYHEILARPVLPYAVIYGVERPKLIPRSETTTADDPDLPPGAPFGILGASSIILRETRPITGIAFSAEPFAFSLQGTDTIDYRDDDLCGVRILVTQPSRDQEYKRYKTTVGERVVVLGEFPVRKFDGNGRPIRDPSGVPDTSFKVRFPADTPYLMQAIDCQGRTLNTDQTWQHLRSGEVKTCNGCHVHGKEGLPFSTTAAARPAYRPVRLGEGRVPLLMGGTGASVEVVQQSGYGLQFEFERDIFPMLQRRCASCHSGTTAASGLVLDIPGTGPGSTYDRLVLDGGQRLVPPGKRYSHPIQKPQLTKYTRALNARGSLLYWKAANQRTDGRTDSQYTARSRPGWEDVDFGPPHPTTITGEELAVLSRWLDTGAAAEAGFLLDTTPPVLRLTAGVRDGAIRTLYVGTGDVVSGVDPASLEVCVMKGAGCIKRFAPRAAPHGVVTVALPEPLGETDGGVEIRARVRDRAGNSTELQYTVRWLLSHPAKSSAPPPA